MTILVVLGIAVVVALGGAYVWHQGRMYEREKRNKH